jgi:hypothetical protein
MQSVYSLELFASKCINQVELNGLLLFRDNAVHGSGRSYPLNTELIGKENILSVTVLPTLLDNGVVSTFEDIIVKGTIKKYNSNETTGPESGELVSEIDFADVIAKKTRDVEPVANLASLFPLSTKITFDNDDLSFRNRLLDAPVITDEKSVLDYAEKLRDILARQDLEALYVEYKPKLDDYVMAYPTEFPDPRQWFVDLFKDDFFPGGPVTEFKRDDIGFRPWCDRRIYEIFVKPAQPYFLNKGLDGDINSIEVFIGMVDGALKIVR